MSITILPNKQGSLKAANARFYRIYSTIRPLCARSGSLKSPKP
nr:hypothetical protein [uncultured Kingella sp.]